MFIGEEEKAVRTLIRILKAGEKKFFLLNEHTKYAEKTYILEYLKIINTACLFSDTGAACVADPGYDLIDMCHANNIDVASLPGPSSITTALSVSGFYAESFYFAGYPPKKEKERQLFFDDIIKTEKTTLFIERPYVMKNLVKYLEKIKNKRLCITYNLGSSNEKIIRGLIDNIKEDLLNMPKAPFVVIVEGKNGKRM
jgi:16S rRNA (cytidine1402-2'-O)-methyltransferase